MFLVKNEVGVFRLYKKLNKWFKEGRKKKFEYCFIGKEIKCFCYKFMFFIDFLSRESDIGLELF